MNEALEACRCDFEAAKWDNPQGDVVRLVVATKDFFKGPWAEVAFEAGWTDLNLFGLGEGTNDVGCGLVVFVGFGSIASYTEIDGDGVTVEYHWVVEEDELTELKRTDFCNDGVVWWRHPTYAPEGTS